MTRTHDALNNKFTTLIGGNKGIIYKVAHLYCRDAEGRKDLVQEITYQLWRAFGSYNDRYKVSTWMYRIALNVSISYYRKQHRRDEMHLPLSEHADEIADTNSFALDENVNLLYRFINDLKEFDKALMLLYLEEHSYAEIADILGITETNVATRISRNKQQLKLKFTNINNK